MDTPILTPTDHAKSIFRENGGLLRMTDAVQAGIHRATLRGMVERGELEKISRGLYRLVENELLPYPDLAAVAVKVPQGVICLISALAFHELTTQIPREISIAIDRNAEPPRIDYPPVRSFRFGGAAFTEGIEVHPVGPVSIRVYSREKTLADCFKFRNEIGLETCLEALKEYRQQPGFNPDEALRFAAICRVGRIIRPYLEAVL
ncbi:MAG TPA: type IV toxin-antitoxin system AbiEi family antitoxin domain-containing protein [Planctomicrobium sp.]|nr:type IV toxin-antitoxin system AbiEi family antitoxin domain-containing protein [Planctomicrobium sp.]